MGTVSLGGKEYPLARPDDLAARIVASSGISLAEAVPLLVESNIPALLARAVIPLLPANAPDTATVGELVGAGDMAEISAAVAPFYADDAAAPAPVTPDAGNDGDTA